MSEPRNFLAKLDVNGVAVVGVVVVVVVVITGGLYLSELIERYDCGGSSENPADRLLAPGADDTDRFETVFASSDDDSADDDTTGSIRACRFRIKLPILDASIGVGGVVIGLRVKYGLFCVACCRFTGLDDDDEDGIVESDDVFDLQNASNLSKAARTYGSSSSLSLFVDDGGGLGIGGGLRDVTG